MLATLLEGPGCVFDKITPQSVLTQVEIPEEGRTGEKKNMKLKSKTKF